MPRRGMVTAQEMRPFVVETFNARFDVLGPTFDVRAWPGQGQDETQVTVVTGRVRVAGRKAGSPAVVLARPGDATRVGQALQQPTAPRPAVLDHVLAWRRGGFAVAARPLGFIFAELERRFGIEIDVRTPSPEPAR